MSLEALCVAVEMCVPVYHIYHHHDILFFPEIKLAKLSKQRKLF